MINKIKGKVLMFLVLGSNMMALSVKPVSASLGSNAEKLANTAQSEGLGLAEALGLIGIVGCGVLIFIGQRDIAKKVGIGVLAGYFILKYAQPIWSVIKGGI